jgi:adenosylhomocysteinase
MNCDIEDSKLASTGAGRIDWAKQQMPVLNRIAERFTEEEPLHGLRIGACLHVTTETANLVLALKSGGADVALCASNPLSTQDDVAASLVVNDGIPVFARKGENRETYYAHVNAVLETQPHITLDDGADLVSVLHSRRRDQITMPIGGTEETTTGVIRLRSMEKESILAYPIIAVNDAQTKHLFDNRYGTGQSVIDGILRATNTLLAGAYFVVCGFGWCGKGIAARAKGMGANVIITEVDPLRALEAVMEGYRVLPMQQAAAIGSIFVTTTGNKNVIRSEHFGLMTDGAILANAGHFDVEIDIAALRENSVSERQVRPYIEQYMMPDGRHLNLLADGRLVNLGSAEGHPASVMDLSFSNQALSVEYIAQQYDDLERRVYAVPDSIDREVALLKLSVMDVHIDALTDEQEEYLSSWQTGT